MSAQVDVELSFSPDPLSDTTPTYTDVSAYQMGVEWGNGQADELGPPTAASATFRLRNTGRRFEPEYTGGVFYPNMVPLRRWKLRVRDGVGTGAWHDEGIWYAKSFRLENPTGDDSYSEIVVECVDKFGLASLGVLPEMNPADASSYEEVVNSDGPAFYYRMGEPEGTKLVGHVRSKKWRRRHPRRPKSYRTVETREELGGVSGPAGTYKNNPELGVPGLILGDTSTAVHFDGNLSQYAVVPLDESDLIDTNRLTVECWVHLSLPTFVGAKTFLAGPNSTVVGDSVFKLYQDAGALVRFELQFTDGTIGGTQHPGPFLADPNPTHLVGTWDGQTLIFYYNGVEEYLTSQYVGRVLRRGNAGGFLYIARSAAGDYASAILGDVAVYEKALSPERVLAHYQAGAERGYAAQTAGGRVAAIVTDAGLGSTAGIQTTGLEVAPVFRHGQPLLEEIEAAATSEAGSLFFFGGDGDPEYRGWEFQAASPYNAAQATLGMPAAAGELGYSDVGLVYDDEIYNRVVLSNEEGNQATAADSTSDAAYFTRAYSDTGLNVTEQPDLAVMAGKILDLYKDPRWRIESVTLNGKDPLRRTQILTREIGDMVRVKHRGPGGQAVDVQTHILAKRKTITAARQLSCTWTLARGFNAAAGLWRAGIVGFSEAGSTTVAA